MRRLIQNIQVIIRRGTAPAILLVCLLAARHSTAAEAGADDETNSFPSVPEVLGGQTFETEIDRDIYFLRAIHDRYRPHWAELLEVNITVHDHVLAPKKLLRFVTELGEAMRDRDDPTACADLALITGSAEFYADGDADHPDILQAAAQALIKIGPRGAKALADSMSMDHYRRDTPSLEVLANAIGQAQPADPEISKALAAIAFKFTTTNGAFYPRCTTTAVKNLLLLTNGPAMVAAHLKSAEVFDNPGRLQSIVDGIAAARCVELSTNLVALEAPVSQRLGELANSPGGYRDDLGEFRKRLAKVVWDLGRIKK
jgi:hypothetical protein